MATPGDPKTVGEPAYFALRFSPSVELISVVRRFVADFYQNILHDDDAVSRVALATHELLENAVRYSIDGETTIRIDVTEELLTIQIDNIADANHRTALAGLFAEMNAAEDAFEHYRELMIKNARRTDGSGLGLARIRAEAEMDLDCEVAGDTVRIFARARLAPRGEPPPRSTP
jgi:hypothetical protein